MFFVFIGIDDVILLLIWIWIWSKAEVDTDEVYAQVTLVPHHQVWMLSLSLSLLKFGFIIVNVYGISGGK